MKKMFALFLALIIVLSFAACGSTEPSAETTAEPTTEPFDIEEYKNLVSDCVSEIYDGSVLLSNVVTFEYKYLKAFKSIAGASSTPSIESVVSTGIQGLEENSEYTEEFLKSQYDDISAKYKEIILSAADNTEVNEFKTASKEMHEAYVSLYNLAFSPDLDMSALASAHDEYTKTIKSCKATLDILLS